MSYLSQLTCPQSVGRSNKRSGTPHSQVNIKHVRSLHKFILEQYLRNIITLLEVCPYNIWIQNPLEWILEKFSNYYWMLLLE